MIQVKSKRNTQKIVGIVVVFMILFLTYASYHYFIQGGVVQKYKDQVIVNESGDLEYLRNKTEDELKEIGFTSNEIEVLHEINDEQVSLNQLLQSLLDEQGSVEIAEMHRHNELLQKEEEGDPIINIHAEPVETVYLDDKETFVTKIHYTASINKPLFFQRQDFFYMLFNSQWNRLFGYTKLHYVSNSGETFEEYVVSQPIIGGISESDFQQAIETRKRMNGKWFYLSGFSGIHVVEANSDLIIYGKYYHQRLSGYKVTDYDSYWKIDFSKYK